MTAVAEDLNLERWVEFTGSEPCRFKTERQPDRCGREASWVAHWHQPCGCGLAVQPLCGPHKDRVAQLEAESPEFWCMTCGSPIALLRMEPIR